MKKEEGAIIIVLVLTLIFIGKGYTGMFSYAQGSGARLEAWDETEPKGGGFVKLTYKTSGEQHAECWNKPESKWNVKFFANYTNSSGDAITNETGNCSIRFNYTGAFTPWANMEYNSSSYLWEYGRNFTYKGVHVFEVNCTSNYENLLVNDSFTINNTGPCIFGRENEDPNGPLPQLECNEDSVCYYNFSKNVTDDDVNDVITYESSASYPWFSLDGTSGMITISPTKSNESGSYNATLVAKDSDTATSSTTLPILINEVNDAPVFTNLGDTVEALEDENFYLALQASDEEGNTPFHFNATFIGCEKAPWNVSDSCDIFSVNESSGEINFTPTNWDVGNYTVNFTVRDTNENVTPYNNTGWKVVTFRVLNVNDAPVITANQTNFTFVQGEHVLLTMNGTDIENDTLVFNTSTRYRNLATYVNESLFPIVTNASSYPSEPARGVFNLTLTNSHVGNYTVKVSLSDSKDASFIYINFTILNLNDPPSIEDIPNLTAVEGIEFYYKVNASDPDNFPSYVPYNDAVNGSITFNLSFINCSKEFTPSDNCSIFGINETTGEIRFTPKRNDTGNYTVNVSVRDGGNLTAWKSFNLTVIADTPPDIYLPASEVVKWQNEELLFVLNATDYESDVGRNDTFSLVALTLYRNLSACENGGLFPMVVDNSSYPQKPVNGTFNFTLSNAQVGNYTVKVVATDEWGRENVTYINFTIYNVNDPPEILSFIDCYTNNSEAIGNKTVNEDENFCKVLNVSDPDMLTPYGDVLTFNLSVLNCSQVNASDCNIIKIDESSGTINFTVLNDSYSGNYTINISTKDSNGSVDFVSINVTVNRVNDAPFFLNLPENLTAFENSTFFMYVNASDEENNIPLKINVTFISCEKEQGGGCDIFNITKYDNYSAYINFTPGKADVGNYTLNFTVEDTNENVTPYNNTGWKVVNMSVLKINHPPHISSIIVLCPSGDTWVSCGTWPSQVNYTVKENETLKFLIADMSDEDNDTLTCEWFDLWEHYRANVENGCGNQISPGPCENGGITPYTPTFSDSGEHNITLRVSDGELYDYATITVNVTNVNRAPYLLVDVPNQTFNMNTKNENIVLKDYFRDDDNTNRNPCNQSDYINSDDNPITYGVNKTLAPHLTVTINQPDGKVTIMPQKNWFGTEYLRFSVNDTQYEAKSNLVKIVVNFTEFEPEKVTETVTRTITRTEYQTKVASLSIRGEKVVRIDENATNIIPLEIENTGEVDLAGIKLRVWDNSKDINSSVEREEIGSLKVGKSEDVEIRVKTGALNPNKTYIVTFNAHVPEPKINTTLPIYLVPNIANKTEVKEKIIFAKDLFHKHPECMELNELILDAERNLEKGEVEKARQLTEMAVENCRHLISYRENMTAQRVVEKPKGIPTERMLNIFLILSILSIILYYYIAKRRAVRRVVKRRKSWGGGTR